MMNLRRNSRVFGMSTVILASFVIAGSAEALTVKFADDVSPVSETPWITCPRDNDGDVCRTSAFCSPVPTANGSAIFSGAWDDFKSKNAGWTNVDGGALEGTLTIDKFKAYSECPKNQGVEISASFEPKGADPISWRWSQGLFATKTNPGHNGPVPARESYMDCNIARAPNSPPLYPYSYPDGHFYDRPGRQCIDSSTVSWTGVLLLSTANFATKKLTTYQGITWGFNVTCKPDPTPEPATMLGIGAGLVALVGRRRKRR